MRKFYYIFFVIIILTFSIITIAKADSDIYDLTRDGYSSFGPTSSSKSAADIDIDASGDIGFGTSASCTDIKFDSNFNLGNFIQQMLGDIDNFRS